MLFKLIFAIISIVKKHILIIQMKFHYRVINYLIVYILLIISDNISIIY